MSRMGKLPIKVVSDIKVEVKNSTITFNKGNMKKIYDFGDKVNVVFEGGALSVAAVKEAGENKEFVKFVGLHRSNINNIVKGFTEGFKKVLEYNGVGYRASITGEFLVLGLGYSHDIAVKVPNGIKVTSEKPNLIIMESSDNIALGRFAAFVKSLRKTEPYKGKGIKFQGETILRKEGKKK
jgi:large subunit ribosomal protein L6